MDFAIEFGKTPNEASLRWKGSVVGYIQSITFHTRLERTGGVRILRDAEVVFKGIGSHAGARAERDAVTRALREAGFIVVEEDA